MDVPRRSVRTARVARIALALLALGTAACSGGGGGVVTPPRISCGGHGAVDAAAVALQCGGASDDVTERVDVVLRGPASGSLTVRGFNFDLTYDPSSLELVPDPQYVSALLPDALVLVSLLDGHQGRVVVSAQQPGGLPAASAGAGQQVKVLGLAFRRLAGATFQGTPLAFENAEATASSLAVQFTSDLTLSYP